MSRRRKGEPGFPTPPQARTVNIPVKAKETVLVLPDMHYPVNCKPSTELVLRWAADNRPDTAFQMGDGFDFCSLSSHRRGAKQILDAGSIRAEARSAKADFAKLAKYSKRRFMGPGNHEERIYAHIDEHPALYGIEWYDLVKEALDGWTPLPARYLANMGLASLCHGHTLKGSLNKNSAATVLGRNPGQHTYYGHTHRIDRAGTSTWARGEVHEHEAATLGHLVDLNEVEYTEDDPWRKGFGVIKFFKLPDGRIGHTFTQLCVLSTPAGLVLHCPFTDKVYT